jgi:hypothetical protein
MSAAPGWYDDGSGRQRWWDGTQWTEHYGNAVAPQEEQPIRRFTSHVDGLNAIVSIFPNRIEWLKPGVFRQQGTETLPISSISSVRTKRDGMLNTVVTVVVSNNDLDFRVSHAEAVIVRDLLNRLLFEVRSAPAATAAVHHHAAEQRPDPIEQIRQLAQLRDAGVVSEAEFEAKKAQLLSQI